MTKITHILLFSLLLLIMQLASCTNQNKEAENYLISAKTAYENGRYDEAKLKIDSIKALFPKNFDVIKQSITLLNEVRYAENTKNITFCDSALKAGEQQLKMLKSQFNYYKDQYMDHGMYIPKNYPLDNALGTNSLRSAVEETGDMFIESVLSNRSINHNQLKITRNDTTFVETNKVTADGLNYKVGNYEIVRFTAKDENGLAKFIYSFQNEPLSLTFIGNKTVTTQMSQASKKGIALSYELYNLMKQMNELTIEKQKSLALIDYLETKKSKEEK
ncbi:MAG: hypothetical protein VB024_08325 [Dysgonamonadaceae bacterium]|nr:hypothetical protein [Dysgonamonadaceae bacterium]